MDKYTKIVATIGPASQDPDILKQLRAAGMNAARINLSHGDSASHAAIIDSIRTLGADFPILLDTKGPEIRIGNVANGALTVTRDMMVQLTCTESAWGAGRLPVTYPRIGELPVGTRVLFDDGLIESEVVDQNGDGVVVRIENAGVIGAGKKVTIQGFRVVLPFLTESGFTARNVSRFKPKSPILAITRDPKVLQHLQLVRGVFPVTDEDDDLDLSHYDMSKKLVRKLFDRGLLTLEDRIIITSGSNLMRKRGTNLLEIYDVIELVNDREGRKAADHNRSL